MMRRFAWFLIPYKLRYPMSKVLNKIKGFVSRIIVGRSTISNWKKRAKQYGPRAVLNIGHSDEEIEAVTEMQRKKIFPFLKQVLTGRENTILDFGCGPGRFTYDLAELIHGNAIGIDPVHDFLEMAPKCEVVEYRLMKESHIPVTDKSIDVVWICLVLGGIVEEKVLNNVVSEIDRVLVHGGHIALIENTTNIEDGDYWKFRSVEFYQSLFNFAELEHSSDYDDLGENISIMKRRQHV